MRLRVLEEMMNYLNGGASLGLPCGLMLKNWTKEPSLKQVTRLLKATSYA